MNKKVAERHWKKILSIAQMNKRIYEQCLTQATQLESEALSALEDLGGQPKHARRGFQLADDEIMKLMGNLTK